MNRFWLWLLVYGLMLLALVVFAKHIIGPAHAHSWYSRTGCCGGSDCAAVPIDAQWIQPGQNGYRVSLTVEQARMVNPESINPVEELVPWHSNKIKPFPVLKPGESYGPPALYHLCISKYGWIYCLFPVPGT